MRAAINQAASATAEALAQPVVSSTQGSRVALRAPAGSGSSLVLRQTAKLLQVDDVTPIVVAPPPRQIDTAALALVDVLVGLGEADASASDGLDSWLEPAGWWERLAQVRTSLSEASEAGKVVLLVDDPSQWSVPGSTEYSLRCESALDLLFSAASSIVVVRSDLRERPLEFPVPIRRPVGLLDEGTWGEELASTVDELRDRVPFLASASPVAVGLATALAAVTSVDSLAARWSVEMPAAVVADELVEVVSGRKDLRPLWASWVACAMPRRGVPLDWLPDFARVELADPLQRAILHRCLLAQNDKKVALVREARAAAWRVREEPLVARVRADASSPLHAQYRLAADEALAEGSFRFLELVAEEMNLAARVPDARPLGAVPVPFSDVFNSVGVAALSRSDWDSAAECFSFALEQDPDDAFALHYLGFSLDNEALEPRRVEHSYRQAIERDATHSSWHERLISFLIVQARTSEASFQFSASLGSLLRDDGDAPLDVYLRFHQPIVANLLRRSELVMTARVLSSIPSWAGERLAGLSGQWHRLEVMLAAQDGPQCVPSHRAVENWWQQPELLGLRHADGRPLHTWIAAAVEEISDIGVGLRVGVVVNNELQRFGSTTLAWDFIERVVEDERRLGGLDLGDFLEIGYYGHGSELSPDPVVRILPREVWPEGLETPLDPMRYIEKAFG
ncbi:MAG: hypothetical protein ACRBI6_16995 [Acidimicrobiales bacterium]